MWGHCVRRWCLLTVLPPLAKSSAARPTCSKVGLGCSMAEQPGTPQSWPSGKCFPPNQRVNDRRWCLKNVSGIGGSLELSPVPSAWFSWWMTTWPCRSQGWKCCWLQRSQVSTGHLCCLLPPGLVGFDDGFCMLTSCSDRGAEFWQQVRQYPARPCTSREDEPATACAFLYTKSALYMYALLFNRH